MIWRWARRGCRTVFCVATAACADAAPRTAVAAAVHAEQFSPTSAYGFVLRTESGDTVAIERVRRGPTWRDAQLWLPRRGELDRFVLHLGPDAGLERWDVTRVRKSVANAWREPERWRVHVRADSLYVTQGALIGERFTWRAISAPRGTMPWHNASGALLEEIVQRTTQVPVAALPFSSVVRSVRIESLDGDSVLLRHPDGDWRLAVDQAGRLLGGVANGRRLRLARIASPPDSLFDGARRVEERVNGAAHIAEEVVLRASDGVTLAGTFTKPRGTLQAPAVLLVSGAGPQDRDLSVPEMPDYRLFAALADSLATRGVATLRLDDRGTGRSGGVAFGATTRDEADDVCVAWAWLRGRPDVRADRIALVGHSDGGVTVLHAAETHSASAPGPRGSSCLTLANDALQAPARDPLRTPARLATRTSVHSSFHTSAHDALRALVLIGTPSRSGRELARLQRRLLVASDSVRFPPAQRGQTLALLDAEAEQAARLDPWLRSWLDHSVHDVAWRSSVPVLLVHGQRDQQVPVAQVDELAALLRRGGSRAVRIALVPDVNHLLVTDSSGDPRGYRALRTHAVTARALGPIVEWLVMRLE